MVHSRQTFVKACRRGTLALGSVALMVALSPLFSSSQPLQAAADTPAGTFSGTVILEGAAPVLADLVTKGNASVKDAAVCAAASIPNETLVVGKSGGIENVFVYLVKAPDGYVSPPVPKEPVVFDQKGCRFLPHALIMRSKQEVLVKSGDAVAHNTHTFPSRSTAFNQVIPPVDRVGVPMKYDKPEKLPVEVRCDLHTWMKAYHLPLDHPFMAVTDANGKFSIPGLPPGKHKFVVWQEKVGYLNRTFEVDIKAGKPLNVELKFSAEKFATYNGPRPRSVIVSSVD